MRLSNTLYILVSVVLTLLIFGTPLVLYIMAAQSKIGDAPGLANNQLAQCTKRPNCVTSEFTDDRHHYIDPIKLPDSVIDTHTLNPIKQQIVALGGTVQRSDANYLSATFESRLFGFIDDLEVRLDRNRQLLHIRSASRVGWSDGGANRKRVEKLRSNLQSAATASLRHESTRQANIE